MPASADLPPEGGFEGGRRLGEGLLGNVLKVRVHSATVGDPALKGLEIYVAVRYGSHRTVSPTSTSSEWNIIQSLPLDDAQQTDATVSLWAKSKQEGRADVPVGSCVIPLEEGFLDVTTKPHVNSPPRTFALYSKEYRRVGSMQISLAVYISQPPSTPSRTSSLMGTVPLAGPLPSLAQSDSNLREGKEPIKEEKKEGEEEGKKKRHSETLPGLKKLVRRVTKGKGDDDEDKTPKRDDEKRKSLRAKADSTGISPNSRRASWPVRDKARLRKHTESDPGDGASLEKVILLVERSLETFASDDTSIRSSERDTHVRLMEMAGVTAREGVEYVLDVRVGSHRMSLPVTDSLPNPRIRRHLLFPHLSQGTLRIALRDAKAGLNTEIAACDFALASAPTHNGQGRSRTSLLGAELQPPNSAPEIAQPRADLPSLKTVSVPTMPARILPTLDELPSASYTDMHYQPVSVSKRIKSIASDYSDYTTTHGNCGYSSYSESSTSLRSSRGDPPSYLDDAYPGWMQLKASDGSALGPSILIDVYLQPVADRPPAVTSPTPVAAHGAEGRGAPDSASIKSGPGAEKAKVKEEEEEGPGTPVPCACTDHHQDLYSHIFPVGVNRLYQLMWEDADMRNAFLNKRECLDINCQAWSEGDAIKTRQLTYTMPLNQPIGPKTTRSIETQKILKDTKLVKVVETVSDTPDVPFGTHFSVILRYCTTYEGPGKTKLSVTYDIPFKKNTMLKSAIKKATAVGLNDLMALLTKTLLEHMPEAVGAITDSAAASAESDVRDDNAGQMRGDGEPPTIWAGEYLSGRELAANRLLLLVVVALAVVHVFLYHQVGSVLAQLRALERAGGLKAPVPAEEMFCPANL